jgi:hypothetical protein
MKLQKGLAEDTNAGEKSKAQKKAKPTSTVEQSRTRGETILAPVTPSQ